MAGTAQQELPLRTVPAKDVFNLPLYEHYLVIDTRAKETYERGHIATAISYPCPPESSTDEEREKSLYLFAKSYAKAYVRPENPNPVVIYGGCTEEELIHSKWLTHKLRLLQTARKAVTLPSESEAASCDDEFHPLERFCQTVAYRVKEVWLLEGGYDAFLREYGFLCGNVAFESMHPAPHHVTRELFLGSRVVPLTQDYLRSMRIPHMIVSRYQKLDWNELRGMAVLKCSIRDSNEENMLPCWEASCQFIDEAARNGGRVLVILHGRSRSASIVLAYLMRKMLVMVDKAWELLSSSCWHLIDRSMVYEEQLRAWQKQQFPVLES